MSKPELFVSCVEPSGDLLAAETLARLTAHHPDLPIYGGAGPAMRALGVEATVPMESMAVMGISAVLGRLPTILDARRRLRTALGRRPAVALFVDGPSMHLPLAAEARRAGVHTIGLVCPQVWAWKPERIPAIAQAYETILCLFDFEPPLLQAACAVHGSRVIHVGHPVLDRVPSADARVPAPTTLFGLAPGSRPQELRRHTRPFLDTARAVRRRLPSARFLWAGRLPEDAPPWLTATTTLTDLQPCHAVLTKSGTITLELAQMGVPQVVAHNLSWPTHLVGRLLVRHLQHIALPNILNRREVVPETVGRLQPAVLSQRLIAARTATPVSLPGLGRTGSVGRITQQIQHALQSRAPGAAAGPIRDGRLPGAA